MLLFLQRQLSGLPDATDLGGELPELPVLQNIPCGSRAKKNFLISWETSINFQAVQAARLQVEGEIAYSHISGTDPSPGHPNIKRNRGENPSSGTAAGRLIFNFILEPETL
jgi:hypothetical protein